MKLSMIISGHLPSDLLEQDDRVRTNPSKVDRRTESLSLQVKSCD